MTDRRIVHLGLGNFHRAHQCWWTWAVAHPDDAEAWSITAFTGRRPDAAALLNAQGCRYTLVERDNDGDRFEIVTALREAFDGADLDTLAARMVDPATGIVTLTVTEAGYALDATPPKRLLHGLRARFRANGAPIAVVPCDNISTNGVALCDVLLRLADREPALQAWLSTEVSFVNTSVDRITPRATDADILRVREVTGFADKSPVITEPFRYWVLSGDFPAGRPRWDRENALFVPEIEPWEQRKLWMLNGAHSMIAYLGLLRGRATVADAMDDDVIASAVEDWWDEVAVLLEPTGLDDYRRQLRTRFANSAIGYRLTQITENGASKMRVRLAEPATLLRKARRDARAAALAMAAWVEYTSPESDTAPAIAAISAALADDAEFLAGVSEQRHQLGHAR